MLKTCVPMVVFNANEIKLLYFRLELTSNQSKEDL